jgi:hypothetical protein
MGVPFLIGLDGFVQSDGGENSDEEKHGERHHAKDSGQAAVESEKK